MGEFFSEHAGPISGLIGVVATLVFTRYSTIMDRVAKSSSDLRVGLDATALATIQRLEESNQELSDRLEIMHAKLELEREERRALEGVVTLLSDGLTEIRDRIAAGIKNGEIDRRLIALEKRARETSARFGVAGKKESA